MDPLIDAVGERRLRALRLIATSPVPPSLHELCAAAGWSGPSGAAKGLIYLADHGLIYRTSGARAVAVTPEGWHLLRKAFPQDPALECCRLCGRAGGKEVKSA